jgi:hypothetical protein
VEPSSTPFFQLPKAGQEHVIRVKLADGQIVERAPDELIKLPSSLNVPVQAFGPAPARHEVG